MVGNSALRKECRWAEGCKGNTDSSNLPARALESYSSAYPSSRGLFNLQRTRWQRRCGVGCKLDPELSTSIDDEEMMGCWEDLRYQCSPFQTDKYLSSLHDSTGFQFGKTVALSYWRRRNKKFLQKSRCAIPLPGYHAVRYFRIYYFSIL